MCIVIILTTLSIVTKLFNFLKMEQANFWIMFTVGSVGRHNRSVLSVGTWSICRPSSGPHSVDISAECRSNVSRVSVQYQSIRRPILD